MPPKRPQAAKAESKSKADAVDEAPLQAVILADSYNRRFEVLCQDQPRILLPLCSTPLLTWTLENLSLSKVKQVFIFCGVHADKIRDFVAKTPYRYTLDIQCLSSQTARTAGDALRELDAMHVLNPDNPFLLVHGPMVSNYDLSKMVEVHRKRKEKDPNFIMTMGVARGGRHHPESPMMVVQPSTSQLVHYSQNPLVPSRKRLTLPTSIFLDIPKHIDEWEVWSGTSSKASANAPGYSDIGVDVCEADVPALCTENFDYHDMRRHFVNGVLTDELLGKKIAVHLIGSEEEEESGKGVPQGRYVKRIRDTRTYAEVVDDVLKRWSFPLVPDLDEPGGVQYELRRGNLYIAKDNVILSRTTMLDGPVLIGPRSALNTGTTVIHSTLGADCTIGPHTTIDESYLFDNVVVGASCVLDQCIVGRDVRLGDKVMIGRGSLIGDGVVLGKGMNLPPFSRVGREKYVPDDADSDEEGEDDITALDSTVLGNDSKGFLWPTEEEEPASDSEDDEDDPYENPRNKRYLQLGRRLSDISISAESVSVLSIASASTASTPLSLASDDDLPEVTNLALDSVPPAFHAEASASLARAYEEDHKVENAMLELRTLVMGYNAGIDRAREKVDDFLMSKVDFTGSAGQILQSTTKVWSRWGELAKGSSTDITNLALDVQKYCVDHPEARPYIGIVLRGLYESDVLAEEDLVEWRSLSTARGEGAGSEEEKKLWLETYAKGKAYVDVLEEMESESEGEDDDEESDEE